ncbi:MAG TPA: glucoamylase family protein [Solirubrobacteraceae bacterium]
MRLRLAFLAVLCTTALATGLCGQALAAGGGSGLTAQQRAVLHGIAADTWRFYAADIDPVTHLPLDNLGPGAVRGTYTSAANIGVYLWAVVAARDMHLIDTATAQRLASATLNEVASLKRYKGFLFQLYDTTNGKVLLNPGQGDCPATPPTVENNCGFLSAVDNGWYASGLMVAREALPGVSDLASRLLGDMDFSIFYDNRPQTDCNTNASIPGNQPTGQQYGGFYVDPAPAHPTAFHNGALYSDPRISMYIGMGLRQMPGDVWWREWRTLPPQRCPTDPDFSFQGQFPPPGQWETITDPISHKQFQVWEGHYVYPGTDTTFIPTFSGGMFEGLMANLVVPETQWGTHSFGLADLRLAQVQERYDTQVLHDPVWGMSPSSTPDDSGNYSAFGVQGLAFGAGEGLAQDPCAPAPGAPCTTEDAVTPHASAIALPVIPQEAYANLQRLRSDYPGLYGTDGGFFDSVNPKTGSIGHRRLVLDQSMIMAGLDDALNNDALQRDFAKDPVSWAAKADLTVERMTIH